MYYTCICVNTLHTYIHVLTYAKVLILTQTHTLRVCVCDGRSLGTSCVCPIIKICIVRYYHTIAWWRTIKLSHTLQKNTRIDVYFLVDYIPLTPTIFSFIYLYFLKTEQFHQISVKVNWIFQSELHFHQITALLR